MELSLFTYLTVGLDKHRRRVLATDLLSVYSYADICQEVIRCNPNSRPGFLDWFIETNWFHGSPATEHTLVVLCNWLTSPPIFLCSLEHDIETRYNLPFGLESEKHHVRTFRNSPAMLMRLMYCLVRFWMIPFRRRYWSPEGPGGRAVITRLKINNA